MYFVPHRTLICEQLLQEERVLRKVDVGEYPLDLVPLEKDVLSLELDGLFRQVGWCTVPWLCEVVYRGCARWWWWLCKAVVVV